MYLLGQRQGSHGRVLDLNLLPPAHRPRALPLLGATLGLLAAVGVILLLAIFQFKASADGDVGRLQNDLQATRSRLAELVVSPTVEAGGRADLSKYRIPWSRVLQTILASSPGDVRVQDVGFAVDASAGPQAIVKGEAAEYAAVVEFADNLRSSPVFSRVSIQSMSQAAPITPTVSVAATQRPGEPPPTQVRAATPTPVSIFAPPTASETAIPPTPRIVLPSATPTPTPDVAKTATGTPTVSATPAATGTATNTSTRTATPTATVPPVDFMVLAKDQTCDPTAPANYSGDLVTGRVLDFSGSAMPGIRVRVASIYTTSPWSAETTTDGEGGFRFFLTKGNFKAEVLSGTSQVANELWTLSAQQTGVCWWHVTFKKTNASTPVPAAPGTATVTATPSISPTPSATAANGTNLTGSPNASRNAAEAGLAIDGDTATQWNAGAGPNQWWEETFTTTNTINGVGLMISQNPAGTTNHVVHFYDINGAELGSLTVNAYTFDGQWLFRSLSTPLSNVKRVRVETTAGPSSVAWYEVQVYMPPPTVTPTPTITPTPTVTPTRTPTAEPYEPDNVWQQAQPVPIDSDPQARTFHPVGDVDWGMFFASGSVTTTYWIRASGDSPTHPTITLYQGTGEQTGFRAYSTSACSSWPNDSLLSFPLQGGTNYFLKFVNLTAGATGRYTITVSTSTITCPTSPADTLVPEQPSPTAPSGSTKPVGSVRLVGPGAWAGRVPGLSAPLPDFLWSSSLAADNADPPRQTVTFRIVLDVREVGP